MVKKNAAPVLRVIQNQTSKEVIDTLLYLLQEAEGGRLIGFAYGAMLPQGKFFVDAAGAAYRSPLVAMGIIQCLSNELNARIRGNG